MANQNQVVVNNQEEEEEKALIPGLPDDIALECLSRLPHLSHSSIRPVCRQWRDLVTSPSFLRHRHLISSTEDLLLLIQVEKTKQKHKIQTLDPLLLKDTPSLPPLYSLTLYNSKFHTYHRLSSPIPMFSHCALVNQTLLLIGGWDPQTLDPVPSLQLLNLSTMTWSTGNPMSTARSFFACAAVGSKVFVAGGHDGQKNALRSAEVYDTETGEWTSLTSMNEERDECRGVCYRGKFWVVSGYGSENQGRFVASAEWYDGEVNEWRKEEDVWVGGANCGSIFGVGEKMYSVDGRGVREYDGSEWRDVGKVPEGMGMGTCGAVIGAAEGNKVFVTGGDGSGFGWIGDLKENKWEKVETEVGFDGFVYSAAALMI